MVIISISTDTSLISSTSAGAFRARGYATHVDGYHMVIVSKGRGTRATQAPWINGSMYVSGGMLRITASIRAVLYSVRLAKKLRATASRIVVTCQDPFLTGLCALLVSMISGAVLHVQVREDLYGPYVSKTHNGGWLRRMIARHIIALADRIMCASVRIATSLAHHHIDRRRIDIAYLFPPVSHLLAHPPIKAHAHDVHRPVHIVAIGQLDRQENVSTVIRAFSLVSKNHPHIHLHIIGTGPEKAFLQKLTRSLRLRQHVSFHDHDPRDPAGSYLHQADLFVSAAYAEGSVSVHLEAAAHWVPIVSTRTGFVGYELSESSVFVIPEPSVEACAAVLHRAVSDRALWHEKRNHAHEQAMRLLALAQSQQEAVLMSWRKAAESHMHLVSA